MVVSIEHHKDLVHTELLGGWCCTGGLVMFAALEGDCLTPLVSSALDVAFRGGDGVVAVGGRSNHLEEKQKN